MLIILGGIIVYAVCVTFTAVALHEYNDGGCCYQSDEPSWCVPAGLFWPISLPCFCAYRVAKAMFAPKPKKVNIIRPSNMVNDEKYEVGSWKK